MATPKEHYEKAEELIQQLEDLSDQLGGITATPAQVEYFEKLFRQVLAVAQIHATLSTYVISHENAHNSDEKFSKNTEEHQ